MTGKKHDLGKDRWDLMPWTHLQDVVKVLNHGAEKYGDTNWTLVENGTDRYFAAVMRHLTEWRKGSMIDPESGLPHLAHAACSILFLMHLSGGEQVHEPVVSMMEGEGHD